jgi:hypothetical protein
MILPIIGTSLEVPVQTVHGRTLAFGNLSQGIGRQDLGTCWESLARRPQPFTGLLTRRHAYFCI